MADKTQLQQSTIYKAGYAPVHINNLDEYNRIYKKSIEEPEIFWAEQAKQYLTWEKEWDSVLQYDFEDGKIQWFAGGVLNASYNCLDRHMGQLKNQTAFYWEADSPGSRKSITYSDLYEQVNKFAAVLKSFDVKKGDRVVIYMPRILELPAAMLACTRIGAVHTIVFGGLSAKSLAQRIRDCGAKILITADAGYRTGRVIPYKKNVDLALELCPKNQVKSVIVFNHAGIKTEITPGRDYWWHELILSVDLPYYIPPEPMNAEDPLFIIYISGSTGTPKGLVHTVAGYLLYSAVTTRTAFNLKDNDVFWCTTDMGWIAGHTYGIYGPLLNGLTSVLFEGNPLYPDYNRYWDIIEKFRVNVVYTAPTIIRALMQSQKSKIKADISSLKLTGFGGEPIYPGEWQWYIKHTGKNQDHVLNTYYQTEAGGHVFISVPGDSNGYADSGLVPFPGIDAVILDDTGEEARYPGQKGVLCIRKPWPGMARTIYGDHERFLDRYFGQIPGMYFTSDGAMKDEKGLIRITGRIDEVVNVSGHRFGTAEIELILTSHPLVNEAGVVGCPDKIKGRGIYAFVSLKSGGHGSDELKKELVALVRTEIGPIASIDVIQWADGLPKTRSGKIIRHILEKIAADKTDELGDISTIADPAVIENLINEHISLREK